jgi:hypothetical protein
MATTTAPAGPVAATEPSTAPLDTQFPGQLPALLHGGTAAGETKAKGEAQDGGAVAAPTVTLEALSEKDAKRAAEEKTAAENWEKGRKWYGMSLMSVFIVAGLAFTPATIGWLATGIWRNNVFYTDGYFNPYQKVVTAHALTAILMLGLFIAQGISGIWGGDKDSKKRKYHRTMGKYVLSPLVVISCILAVTSELLANACCQEPDPTIVIFAAMIFFGFVMGIRAAIQKRFADHKDHMMWSILISCGVGLTRFFTYVTAPFYPCVNTPYGLPRGTPGSPSLLPFLIATIFGLTVAFVALHSIGRFNWKTGKHNLIIWGLLFAKGIYFAYDSFTWECPFG